MLGGQLGVALQLGELGAGDLADGADLGRSVTLMDVTANRTYPLLHNHFLLNLSFIVVFGFGGGLVSAPAF